MSRRIRRFMEFTTVAGVLLVCYVMAFSKTVRVGSILTMSNDGSMYSVRLWSFHDNPTINKTFYYFYWPIHRFLPRTISSRDIQTGDGFDRCVERRLRVVCFQPPAYDKPLFGQ